MTIICFFLCTDGQPLNLALDHARVSSAQAASARGSSVTDKVIDSRSSRTVNESEAASTVMIRAQIASRRKTRRVSASTFSATTTSGQITFKSFTDLDADLSTWTTRSRRSSRKPAAKLPRYTESPQKATSTRLKAFIITFQRSYPIAFVFGRDRRMMKAPRLIVYQSWQQRHCQKVQSPKEKKYSFSCTFQTVDKRAVAPSFMVKYSWE